MPKTTYHVAPRYTSGSPATVGAGTAMDVARAEVRAAPATGVRLDGIAYSVRQQGGDFVVLDLITHAMYDVPAAEWGTVGNPHWYARPDRARFRRT